VNVAYELQKVGVLIADKGFVTVLEEVPTTIVVKVKRHGIAGKQPSHELCQGRNLWKKQEVKMIRHE